MERASFSRSLVSIPGLDLLDQHDVGFADVEDKVLLLVGEQVLDRHRRRRYPCGGDDPDQQHDAVDIRS